MGANSLATIFGLKRYRLPQVVIGRFVARRTLRAATLWALVFGVYVASKAAGYANIYPTAHERAAIAASLGNNIGLNAILGVPHQMETVAGFTTWNCLSVITIVGAIWGLLLATKTFRGEEQNGRLELLLSGQTTARRAAGNMLAGLGVSLVALYVVSASGFALAGKMHGVGFSTSAALFFALCVVASATMFIGVGALVSQLMPTRSRAASAGMAVFGLSFVLRAMADTTSAHWLLNTTPFGWIEKLQPLYASRPLWLAPCFVFAAICGVLAVYIAGRRDFGESTFADRTTARPRLSLLGSPLAAAFRLTRSASFVWMASIAALALMFGLLTNAASQALDASTSAQHSFDRIAHAVHAAGAPTFLGVIFLTVMTCIMAYAASSVGAMREDEAGGYLDNFLVRKVGRLQWLWGRLLLATVVILLAGLLAGVAAWLGQASQHAGVPFHDLLLAGVNAMAPAILVLGIGICALGLVPRFTTLIAYGAIAWSFLAQMLSSGINLNHWVLDTSILHHIALSPASAVNWRVVGIFVLIGSALALIGALRFRQRDLQVE